MINNLILTSFADSEKVNADIKLQITRSYKKPLPGWILIPQLAPSRYLLKKKMDWQFYFVLDKKWEEYKALFFKEMGRFEQQRYLKQIVKRLKEGRTVALACYCPNEKLCHRRLVKELVEGMIK